MAGGVAGRVHRAHGQVADAHHRAVRHRHVDRRVEGLLAPDSSALVDLALVGQVLVAFARSVEQHFVEGVDRGLGLQRFTQTAAARGVVEVVVGDRDVANLEVGQLLLEELLPRHDRLIVPVPRVDEHGVVAVAQYPDV